MFVIESCRKHCSERIIQKPCALKVDLMEVPCLYLDIIPIYFACFLVVLTYYFLISMLFLTPKGLSIPLMYKWYTAVRLAPLIRQAPFQGSGVLYNTSISLCLSKFTT